LYRDIAYVTFGLDGFPYEGDEAMLLRQRLSEEVGAVPGVDAVALASDPPLGEEMAFIPIRLPGEGEQEIRLAGLNAVTPNYFSLVGISLVRGRTFTEGEVTSGARGAGTRPAIVSETTARNLWPDGDPVGRMLLTGDEALHVIG